MDSTAAPLQKLIEQFARLPGVGRKMAQRFAFYVMDLPEDKAKEFSAAILEAKSKIKKCSVCGTVVSPSVSVPATGRLTVNASTFVANFGAARIS